MKSFEKRVEAFMKEYRELVKKHKVDLSSSILYNDMSTTTQQQPATPTPVTTLPKKRKGGK